MADTDELFAALHGPGPQAGGRHALRPRPQREGARARHGLRRRDVLHGRLGQRDAQPEEHRHGDRGGRTSASSRWREGALAAGKRVQVSVQSAFGCGYEGPVPKDQVLAIVKTYLDAGLRNISLADTAGHAHARRGRGALRRDPRASTAGAEWPATSTTPTASPWPTATRRCRPGVTSFESALAGSAAARSRRWPAATSAPRTSSTRSSEWGCARDIRLERAPRGRTRGGAVLRPGPARDHVSSPARSPTRRPAADEGTGWA